MKVTRGIGEIHHSVIFSVDGSYMDEFKELESIVEEAGIFGFRETGEGARLYGHVPHIGPEARFHVLFRGLSDLDIGRLEKEVGAQLTGQLRVFLGFSNGASLFSRSISIYGLRRSYSRSGDEAWQPFAMETANRIERPEGVPDSYIFIGGYFDDGSKIIFDSRNGKIYRLPRRKSAPILNEWPSLATMLVSEAKRLKLLFDDKGRMLDESATSTPPEIK